MNQRASGRLRQAWQRDSAWLAPLRPLSALTARVARQRLRRFRRRAPTPPVPVLVVGNITVGGTGKTPLVIALCHAFRQRGLTVAVISRGYGARPPARPWPVAPDGDPALCGDEPVLIARETGAGVMIDPDRARALAWTLEREAPDLVISDDGLQHYGLPRTAEVAVVDAEMGLGNGRCLPAGPLREPARRLAEVDWLVTRGEAPDWPEAWTLELEMGDPVDLAGGESCSAAEFRQRYPRVHAVAGIGHPGQFFRGLRAQGLEVIEHPRPDHHVFRAGDLEFEDNLPVVMTAKDAVKCRGGAHPQCWFWPVRARVPDALLDQMVTRLTGERSR